MITREVFLSELVMESIKYLYNVVI